MFIIMSIPNEKIEFKSSFKPSIIQNDISQYLLNKENLYTDIIPGVKKRIIWHKDKNKKTAISVIYIHGFSATSEEIRPLPDLISKELNANLFYTRLSGHGRKPETMSQGSISNWVYDLHEAIEIGSRIGNKIIIMSSSTGGTLSATAALNKKLSDKILGFIFISPNFGINNALARLLTWPFSKYWIRFFVGDKFVTEPRNEKNAQFWTFNYPSKSLVPMANLVKRVNICDFKDVKKPAFFYFSLDDKVVDPLKTINFISNWGGPTKSINVKMTKFDDKYSHVLAGDIISPNQTQKAKSEILKWVNSLN